MLIFNLIEAGVSPPMFKTLFFFSVRAIWTLGVLLSAFSTYQYFILWHSVRLNFHSIIPCSTDCFNDATRLCKASNMSSQKNRNACTV